MRCCGIHDLDFFGFPQAMRMLNSFVVNSCSARGMAVWGCNCTDLDKYDTPDTVRTHLLNDGSLSLPLRCHPGGGCCDADRRPVNTCSPASGAMRIPAQPCLFDDGSGPTKDGKSAKHRNELN